MTELLTAAQMRAIESAAISSGEVSGLELMERAGRGVVEAIFQEWPELAERGASPSRSPGYLRTKDGGRRAVVLCGPGNNGGDGFVVARLLKELGWEVEVFLYGDAGKLPADARVNYERWRELGEVAPFKEAEFCSLGTPEIVVDAIFGTGLTRPIDDLVAYVLMAARDRRPAPKLIAVDVETGFSSDTGMYLGPLPVEGLVATPIADLVVTFERPRVGHFIGDFGNMASSQLSPVRLRIAGIGCLPKDDSFPADLTCEAELTQMPVWWQITKDNIPGSHKYSHGHALILSGGPGRTGAARLAARGALRIGAGLVTLGVLPSAQMEVATQITAVMLKRVADGAALAEVLGDGRINALCLGPGLGLERARELVPVALRTGRGVVLDADALTAFTDDPGALFAVLHENCVLTPHGGEFARLFPDIAMKLRGKPKSGPAFSKVDATREAAARAGCVVLFKGPDTVIAAPDGRCSINSAHYERAAPWLATAGSGDVLAGFITGLLARGFQPMQAAEFAAWLHVECALSFGPGLIAEDIAEELPEVLRGLGA